MFVQTYAYTTYYIVYAHSKKKISFFPQLFLNIPETVQRKTPSKTNEKTKEIIPKD